MPTYVVSYSSNCLVAHASSASNGLGQWTVFDGSMLEPRIPPLLDPWDWWDNANRDSAAQRRNAVDRHKGCSTVVEASTEMEALQIGMTKLYNYVVMWKEPDPPETNEVKSSIISRDIMVHFK